MAENYHLEINNSSPDLTVVSTTSFTVKPKTTGNWEGTIFQYEPQNPFCIKFGHAAQSAQVLLHIEDSNNEGWIFDGQSSIDYIPEHSEGCNSFAKSVTFTPDNKTMMVNFTANAPFIPPGKSAACYAILSFKLVARTTENLVYHSQDPSVGIGIGSQDCGGGGCTE